jgi:hypothetical protein
MLQSPGSVSALYRTLFFDLLQLRTGEQGAPEEGIRTAIYL